MPLRHRVGTAWARFLFCADVNSLDAVMNIEKNHCQEFGPEEKSWKIQFSCIVTRMQDKIIMKRWLISS
jgi:hypothetical protein